MAAIDGGIREERDLWGLSYGRYLRGRKIGKDRPNELLLTVDHEPLEPIEVEEGLRSRTPTR